MKEKKNKLISSRKLISLLHLWPGLISSVIVLFVCFTGTLVVYCDEIMELSAGKARFVSEVKEKKLPAEKLLSILKETYPDRRSPSYMVAYSDPHRSVRFNTYSKENGLRMVYINPYTGEILKDDSTIHFFYVTAHLHNSLLLGKAGQWVVDIATIIFLAELLTGLFLWWPKKWNKSSRKSSLTVKWDAPFKRLTYDLHKVMGFYALGIILVLSVTGLLIAFEPLSQFTVKALGGDPSHQWEKSLPELESGKQQSGLDKVIQIAFSKYPDKPEAQIYTYNIEKAGYYRMRVSERTGLKSAQNPEYILYDRNKDKVIEMPEHTLKHEKIENMVWELHTGNWMGPIGKLITFIGGLIASSLPVTGFFIWWNKKRNKRQVHIEINPH